MLVKTTIEKILKDIVEGKGNITNNSCNGCCTRCGECCTPFLPISQKEINKIQEYVIENNIKPTTFMLVMQNRLTCPYHDGKKCLIYEVRPLICQEFYCWKGKNIDMTTANKFKNDIYYPVDLWAIAREIEKERNKFYARNKRIV